MTDRAPKRSILIVEDDDLLRESLLRSLSARHRVVAVGTRAEAEAAFQKLSFDVVVLDLHLPDGDGLELVPIFRACAADVVVITAFPKVRSAIRALKAGASDYLNKPFDLDEFDIVVDGVLEERRLRDALWALDPTRGEVGLARLLGSSAIMDRLRLEIEKVARSPDTTVLIFGETGTGKELVCDAVHAASLRVGQPLVKIDCASIPEGLLESEMFGHERGAFTGATATRRGLIEAADGGTVFLDEIGEMPLPLQSKLLRLLETRTFRRVGGTREVTVDVRFVAATNRDLDAEVAGGRFRRDLLYRLNVFPLSAPPLRERPGDVILLAEAFLALFARRLGRTFQGFEPEARERLQAYGWPGNVRELRNAVERAAILATGPLVQAHDLPGGATPTAPWHCPEPCTDGLPVDALPTLDEVKRRYSACVLRATDGNRTRAAEVLGVTRGTLRAHLESAGRDGSLDDF